MQRDAANAKLLMSQVDLNHLRENFGKSKREQEQEAEKKNQLKSNGNLFNIYV